MYQVNDTVAFGGFKEREELDSDEWTIINVSSQSVDGFSVQCPLNDGAYDGGNTQEQFDEAVDAVRTALRGERPVFVHCALGQSRSVSVLATALAAEQDRSFDPLMQELMRIRGSFTEPADSLQQKARTYLEGR